MDDQLYVDALVSQLRNAISMLRAAVDATPAELWDDPAHENRTWRLAYHAIWGVRFYLGASPESYVPFEGAVENAESLGAAWEESSEAPPVERVHTPEELVAFIDILHDELPEAVAGLQLEASSGFDWYPFSRFELHLNTLRHVQHHTAQLIERLRGSGITGFDWV